MRGGNRQRPAAERGGDRVGDPPADFDETERAAWREIGDAVGPDGLGTFKASDAVFLRLTVRTVVAAERAAADLSTAPTARARMLQAAGSMLNAFGLSPLSRERVKAIEDTRSPTERVLAAVGGDR
jgi:hypothetical protein